MNKSLLEQLSPTNCQVIFIDHRHQMAFGVQSIDRQVLKNNTVGLAKAAKHSIFLSPLLRLKLKASLVIPIQNF